MHKLNFLFSLQTKLQVSFRIAALCIGLLLPAIETFGQNNAPEQKSPKPAAKRVALPDKIGENWQAIGNARVLSPDQTSVLPDGEIYTEYGLQSLTSRFYTNGKTKVSVELFQTQFPSEAYGLFTFTRATRTQKNKAFQKGALLVSIAGETDETVDQSFLETLKTMLAVDEGELPSLPFNLPEQNKIEGSDKYVIGSLALAQIKEFAGFKNVINFSGGTHAIIGNYGKFSLMIVEYHNPQLATDGYSQFQSYFNNLTAQEKSSRILKRIGNYVVTATNVQDVQTAEAVIASIKYSPKVIWEGKKITDLPIQFRPPDPLAIQEASQTAGVIIRTFYWIGIMILSAILIGFVTGGSFFYWRRYRRRKLGIDDIFSDAGGTVRLNLDEYLLSQGESVTGVVDEKKRIER